MKITEVADFAGSCWGVSMDDREARGQEELLRDARAAARRAAQEAELEHETERETQQHGWRNFWIALVIIGAILLFAKLHFS